MPYTGPQDKSLPKNVQDLSEKLRDAWVKTWNATLAKCQSDGGDDCEGMAFRVANAQIKKMQANEKPFTRFLNSLKALAELFQPDEDAEHDGLMVGVWLDPDTAARLAIPNGEAADALHLTLAYCGKVATMNDAAVARAIAEVANLAAYESTLTGQIAGFGRFNASDESDGKDVIYATADVPGLERLRERLISCLAGAGCPAEKEHGFTPHITLAYVDPGADSPIDALPTLPFTVSALTLCVGDKKTAFTLTGNSGYEMYAEWNGRDLAEIAAHGHGWRLFNAFSFDALPNWIPYLPVPGRHEHARYGDITITRDRNARFVDNFQKRVYGQDLPIDAEHETKLSGALAWVKELRLNANGSADARVEWTDRGKTLATAGRFKYVSPEWYDTWKDPATGVTHQDVAIGAALTTRPFFKESSLRPLLATESGTLSVTAANDFTNVETIVFEAATPKGESMSNQAPPDAKAFADLQAKLTELEKEAAARQASEEAAREQAKTMAEQLQKAQESIKAMETAARRLRFTEMADGSHNQNFWFGKPADHAAVLETLADTFGEDSERFKTYVELQRGMAEQLRQSEIFKEYGRDTSGSTTAAARLEAAAKKLQETDSKLTYEQAYSEVLKRQPKLYAEYRAEQRQG